MSQDKLAEDVQATYRPQSRTIRYHGNSQELLKGFWHLKNTYIGRKKEKIAQVGYKINHVQYYFKLLQFRLKDNRIHNCDQVLYIS